MCLFSSYFSNFLSSAGGRDPAACLVFLSGQLVPACLVFPLLLIFFTKGEITDLGLWAMFSPTPACWRNVASELCHFPRNALLSARWAVALLPISCEKAESLVWQFLGVSSHAEVMQEDASYAWHSWLLVKGPGLG